MPYPEVGGRERVDCRSVVLGELPVGLIDLRLRQVGFADSGLEVIGNGDAGYPAKGAVHRVVGVQPAFGFFVSGSLRKQQMAIAEHPHKDVRLMEIIVNIPSGDFIACPVHLNVGARFQTYSGLWSAQARSQSADEHTGRSYCKW